MGEVYNAAKEASLKVPSGGGGKLKPVRNLAIIVEPLWGDENLEDCVPIGKANSEADRIEKFTQVADNFVVFPGSAATLQEASTLIQKNRYQKNGEAKK